MFIFQVLFRKTGNLLATWRFTLTVFNLIISVLLLVLFFLSGKIIRKGRFLIFVSIIIASFMLQHYYTEAPIIVNYNIEIYDDSLSVATFVLVRIIAIVFTSALLTLTTKPVELNQGLEKLLSPLKAIKLNPAVFCMMVSIALTSATRRACRTTRCSSASGTPTASSSGRTMRSTATPS